MKSGRQPNAALVHSFAPIRRNRISEHLARGTTVPITVIGATGGFGKTIALRHYLASVCSDSVLLRVRPGTGSLFGLLRELSAALERVSPGPCLSFAVAYDRATQSNAPFDVLAAWLYEHLHGLSLTITIDDLHHADGDPQVIQFLDSAISAAPAGIRWILGTRNIERLPLASWLAHNRTVMPLTEIELALTPSEASQLAGGSGIEDDASVRELHRRTAGAPAAFSLGLSCLRAGLISGRDLAGRYATYDFFAERYYEALPPAVAGFMLDACVIPELSAAFMAAFPGAAVIDDYAPRGSSGPVATRGIDGSLQFSDCFREFLLKILSENRLKFRDRIAGAARLQELAGAPLDALRLFRETEQLTEVARILRRNGFAFLDDGHWHDVRDAIDALPEELRRNDPSLVALLAVLESRLGRLDIAEAWYRVAIEAADDTTLKANLTYRYARELMRRERTDCLELLEPYASGEGLPLELATQICGTLAAAYVVRRDFMRAWQLAGRALKLQRRVKSPAVRASVYLHATYVAIGAERPAEGKEYGHRAVNLALQCGAFDTAARAYSGLYDIAYTFEEDSAAALAYVSKVAEHALKAASSPMRLWALCAVYYLHAESGNHDGLATVRAALCGRDLSPASAHVSKTLLPAEALQSTWRNDFEHAYRLLAPSADAQASADRRALRHAQAGLYAAAAGLYTEAAHAVGSALDHAGKATGLDHRSHRARLYLALAFSILEDRRSAEDMLQHVGRDRIGPQTSAILSVVTALGRRRRGANNDAEISAAFDVLWQRHLGGIALMIGALPSGLDDVRRLKTVRELVRSRETAAV